MRPAVVRQTSYKLAQQQPCALPAELPAPIAEDEAPTPASASLASTVTAMAACNLNARRRSRPDPPQ